MSGINNSLGEKLKGFQVHQSAIPALRRTPSPERSKVVGKVDRLPVNKQASLITKPVRDWTAQPPPMPPAELDTKERQEIRRLNAELKSERNAHAATRDTLGRVRQEVATLKKTLECTREQVRKLERKIWECQDTIQQLENLKL